MCPTSSGVPLLSLAPSLRQAFRARASFFWWGELVTWLINKQFQNIVAWNNNLLLPLVCLLMGQLGCAYLRCLLGCIWIERGQGWSLLRAQSAHGLKARLEGQVLAERKHCFVHRLETWGEGRLMPKGQFPSRPLPTYHGARAFKAEFPRCIDRGRGLHAENSSHLWQLSWNGSSVVWSASSWLF